MSSALRTGKIDLKPKRYHGYSVLLFLLGTLFPPLAVAARFGIGSDFWLNLLLTVCGYIPGHGHNFYIQNIRNNKNNRRTPKWVQRYGLVDTSEIRRKQKKSQWASRYNERLPSSTLEGQEYEEGQVSGPSPEQATANGGIAAEATRGGDLWRPEDETYYGQDADAGSTRSGDSGGRWRYPANFDDATPMPAPDASGKKKKGKKDRWARTEDAYSLPDDNSRKRKKKKKTRSTVGDTDSFDRRSDSVPDFPEDAEGGLYTDSSRTAAPDQPFTNGRNQQGDEFEHQF